VIHSVFNRPEGRMKAFDERGTELFAIAAAGDAWGEDGGEPPYGSGYPIPPGHYMLTRVEHFSPCPSEGYGQIYVEDLTSEALGDLVAARKASHDGENLTVGGITLPTGQLAAHNRREIMLHGGGSNLGVPRCYADFQELLKTFGCGRVHNADWRMLASKVTEWLPAHHIIYSCVGDVIALPG